jgi:hypothetical protein
MMGDDLVAEEIEVDPLSRAAPLRQPKHGAIEMARRAEIIDWKGKMKRRRHGPL